MRLTSLAQIPAALRPAYDPAAHRVGIVHLGLGAFHKAHQAALTDLALAASGGDWRILGVSLRSPRAAQELAPQNGLYEQETEPRARVIGALAGALCSAQDPRPALAAMADPQVKIVSVTVTEKAYGLDRAGAGIDPAHPAIAADLANPTRPQGVIGMIVRGLALRFAGGNAPFTVLCCDNLPDNGALLRAAVVDFAHRIDPALAARIGAEVAFPATMVDRITPAPTEATRARARALIGAQDLAAVETERFCQWVIEDHFPQGRPDWAAAGAIFTRNVADFEAMKLRMLNGSHSMLAYAGFHAGLPFVRDVMRQADIAALVRRHLAAAAATLPQIAGMDLVAYAQALAQRFENPAIAHETFQIAMDGSEKLPQRIFAAVIDARAKGVETRAFAFATAAWARHLSGATHDCAPYALRDPRAAELSALVQGQSAQAAVAGLRACAFVPRAVAQVAAILARMLAQPMVEVIAQEAAL